MSPRNWILCSVLAISLTVGGVDASAGVRRSTVASAEFDALDAALEQAANSDPANENDYNRARDRLANAGLGSGLGVTTFKGDLEGAFQAYARASRAGAAVPNAVIDAFDVLLRSFEDRTQFTIELFGEDVDTFERANPKKSTKRQRKGIAKAQDLLDRATALRGSGLASVPKRLKFIKKALAKLRGVKTFPFVKRPPKSCPDRIAKGESASGAFVVADFEEQDLVPLFFRANYAFANAGALPGGQEVVSIAFGYCNGHDEDLIELKFSAPATPGLHPQDGGPGGFKRGKIGFTSNLTGGSFVEIETIDTAGRFVTGNFSFRASLGSGFGTGTFVLELDP